jgi:ATPase subunit of ABC transporter with duplicated ATPase domains
MSHVLIQFSQLFISYDSLPIFENISLSIHYGEVLALIGENGSGKTTLLNILGGNMLPSSGTVQKSPHLTIGFLPQEIHFDNVERTAREYIENSRLKKLELEMALCLESPNLLQKWEKLHEEYEKLSGYNQTPLEKVLHGLKIESSILDIPLTHLSSGQKVRLAIAKTLIENPDLLLLDEPTNHLDKEMLNWFQEFLKNRKGASIIVSHDRQFLNNTCNHLMEICQHKLHCYGGNYEFYLKEKKRRQERELEAFLEQEEAVFQLKQKIKAYTFSKRKPSAPSDQNIMAYNYRGENHQKSQQHNINVLKNRLAELEETALSNPQKKNIKGLQFPSAPLSSHIAIECIHITKSFGHKILFSNYSKQIHKGDRIIITGPNGCGKTMLLRCIAGEVSLDAGIIRKAPTAKISYMDQEIAKLPPHATPLEYFYDRFNLDEPSIRKEIHKAALDSSELLKKPFYTLSVGQRKRLVILLLILEKPNVLLLDEPTNHLDLLTLEAFEKALLDFDGAILAISHDSTFINKIANETWDMNQFL